MTKIISLILVLFSFVGCTTVEFVRKDTAPEKKAILRHVPPSSETKAAKYKEEVDKKAVEFCGGGYDITREYQARQPTGQSTGVGTGIGVGMGGILIGGSRVNTSMYNFIELNCK